MGIGSEEAKQIKTEVNFMVVRAAGLLFYEIHWIYTDIAISYLQ